MSDLLPNVKIPLTYCTLALDSMDIVAEYSSHTHTRYPYQVKDEQRIMDDIFRDYAREWQELVDA